MTSPRSQPACLECRKSEGWGNGTRNMICCILSQPAKVNTMHDYGEIIYWCQDEIPCAKAILWVHIQAVDFCLLIAWWESLGTLSRWMTTIWIENKEHYSKQLGNMGYKTSLEEAQMFLAILQFGESVNLDSPRFHTNSLSDLEQTIFKLLGSFFMFKMRWIQILLYTLYIFKSCHLHMFPSLDSSTV